MIYEVIPRGARVIAISYTGDNFYELKRYIGKKIEKANKTCVDNPVLVLDTPYGSTTIHVGDVVVYHNGWWKVITQEEFTKRYEILKV